MTRSELGGVSTHEDYSDRQQSRGGRGASNFGSEPELKLRDTCRGCMKNPELDLRCLSFNWDFLHRTNDKLPKVLREAWDEPSPTPPAGYNPRKENDHTDAHLHIMCIDTLKYPTALNHIFPNIQFYVNSLFKPPCASKVIPQISSNTASQKVCAQKQWNENFDYS